MNKPDFPISWPLEKVKAQGAYFYLEATESYLPGNRVNISGRGGNAHDEQLFLFGS